jgi:hypothetical protein
MASRNIDQSTGQSGGRVLPVHGSDAQHAAMVQNVAVHTPAIPGHDVRPTHAPVLPGHEAGPKRGPSVTPSTAQRGIRTRPLPPKAKPKATSKPVPKGKPATSKAPASGAKPAPAPSTSSPAPTKALTGGGFALPSLFQMMLIGGGLLALWYLYTHRKGGK